MRLGVHLNLAYDSHDADYCHGDSIGKTNHRVLTEQHRIVYKWAIVHVGCSYTGMSGPITGLNKQVDDNDRVLQTRCINDGDRRYRCRVGGGECVHG